MRGHKHECLALIELVGFLCLMVSCSRTSSSSYAKAIDSGQRDIPTIKQFCTLFPQSTHLIMYYNGQNGTPTWTSKVGLYGRYLLVVRMDIQFDSSRERIVGSGQPHFFLSEIEKIDENPAQNSEVTTPGAVYLEFGPEQWNNVVNSKGALEQLGVKIQQDHPVDSFEKWWRRPETG